MGARVVGVGVVGGMRTSSFSELSKKTAKCCGMTNSL